MSYHANGMIVWSTARATAAVIVQDAVIVDHAPYLRRRVAGARRAARDTGEPDGRVFWRLEHPRPGVTLSWLPAEESVPAPTR